MHAFTLDIPCLMKMIQASGVVLRDDHGTIIKMYSGTIRNLTRRANDLWEMLVGLKAAFLEDQNRVELASDNKDVVEECKDWKWFIDPNYANLIQQLEQRKGDPNLKLVVR